ncbi:MAG: hypothetical protein HYU52_09365 [Acidobacteria bacterium]|nr:hypothetical protein [Acidobacteriota bacterium]
MTKSIGRRPPEILTRARDHEGDGNVRSVVTPGGTKTNDHAEDEISFASI